jgi:hypothetical protein
MAHFHSYSEEPQDLVEWAGGESQCRVIWAGTTGQGKRHDRVQILVAPYRVLDATIRAR